MVRSCIGARGQGLVSRFGSFSIVRLVLYCNISVDWRCIGGVSSVLVRVLWYGWLRIRSQYCRLLWCCFFNFIDSWYCFSSLLDILLVSVISWCSVLVLCSSSDGCYLDLSCLF